MKRRRLTGLASALVAAAVAAPIGFALADDAEPQADGGIPAQDCSAEARAIYAEEGLAADTFSHCPTVEEAKYWANEHNLARRNGLTQILESMRAHGGSEAEISRVEQDLNALGGPYLYPEDREDPENHPSDTRDDYAADGEPR